MRDGFIIATWFAAAFGLMIGFIIADRAETQACTAKGGHIIERDTTGIGISSNGSLAVVPSSVSFCVSSDGRILE